MQSERERVIAELMEAFVSYSGTEKQIAEAAYDRGYKAGVEDAAKVAAGVRIFANDYNEAVRSRIEQAIRALAEGAKP